jgi:hypothetical protein
MAILWDLASPILGGVIAFLLQHYWQEMNSGAERRKRRRELLEKLGMLAFERLEYLYKEMRRVTLGKENDLTDQLPTMSALQQLYFPELKHSFRRLRMLNKEHLQILMALIDERKANPALIPISDEWNNQVYKPGLVARAEFLNECRRLIEEDEAWLANTWHRRFNRARSVIHRLRGSKPAE